MSDNLINDDLEPSIRVALLKTGLFEDSNYGALKMKNSSFFFDIFARRWFQNDSVNFTPFERVFELLGEKEQEILIWHLDILLPNQP